MNELIKVTYNEDGSPTVSGRELHEALEVKTPYTQWFERMCDYGFSENEDFVTVHKNVIRADGTTMPQTQTEHDLTISMAKEICMLQRTEKGKRFRQYFIRVEEAWNSPEMIMKRALEFANASVKRLQLEVSTLTVENEIMRPKAEYFDDLVDRQLLTSIRDTAKELKVKEKQFVKFLLAKKYLYRDKRGKLQPYAQCVDSGLFELKEFVNEKTGFSSTQVLVTPKGKETFRLLCIA